MIRIPYTKAHGARNDFLLTWAHHAPPEADWPAAAEAICDRHSGAGADGWLLVTPPVDGAPARIKLFNPDGSLAEMSGNGTRCAAAFLNDSGLAGEQVQILTGAGLKELRLLERRDVHFVFEMDMGAAVIEEGNLKFVLATSAGDREAAILWVGNPQCVFFVDSFDWDWKSLGAEVERHPHFGNRTNVSFVKVVNPHTLDVRFWERGAGFTQSSGTGSTGAVAAAQARGLAGPVVTVHTLAGPLSFRREGSALRMVGPADLVAGGDFYWQQ